LPVFLAAGEAGTAEGACEKAAAYRGILDALAALGADFSGLSGAGSGCFGIFTDGRTAEKAAKQLMGGWNFVQLTFPLARSGNVILE
jgi:4-diphosphocytidyl-2-C-methyl-D-erythritol kinase